MKNNNDVKHNCKSELVLQINNVHYLSKVWRTTIKTGNLEYIKTALDEMGFKYRKDQWDEVVDQFEFELEEREEEEEDECEELDEETIYEEEEEDERARDWMAGRLGY
jgi:hypothetical protein